MTVNVLYGEGEVTIMREQQREVIVAGVIGKLKVFNIKRQPDCREYILRMELKVQQTWSYTVLVSTTQNTTQITQGVPSTFELHGLTQCFSFASSSLKETVSLLVESPTPIAELSPESYSWTMRPSYANSEPAPFEEYTLEQGENTLLFNLVP